MSNEKSPPQFKHIIVAVHGIDRQRRCSTVRSIATRLAASKALLACSPASVRLVASQPLGSFHSEVRDIAAVALLDDAAFLGNTALAATGFAQVFSAHFPEQVAKEENPLVEFR